METIFFSVNKKRKDFEVAYYIGERKKEIYYCDLYSFMTLKSKYENVSLKYSELTK